MANNISFVIFTYNEERRIAYAIRNFIKYGDVYVLDNEPTDRTKEIAEALGAKYFIRPKTYGYIETKEIEDFVKSIIKTEWIYWGYADNAAPKSLVEKMVEIANEDKFKLVHLPLNSYLWGNTEKHIHKNRSPFLFHKDFVDFSNNKIHGLGRFLGQEAQILFLEYNEKNALRHFSTYNTNKFVVAHLRYAEIEASQRFQAGERFSLFRFLKSTAQIFRGIRNLYANGKIGLIVLAHYAFFRFMVETKLYELEHQITLESIEAKYSAVKEKMLEEIGA